MRARFVRNVLLVLLPAPWCTGATYYVAPGGDDAYPGTQARPFRTIQKGAGLLKAGDTLLVGPGVYRESVRIGKLFGAKEKPIVIRAAVHRAL